MTRSKSKQGGEQMQLNCKWSCTCIVFGLFFGLATLLLSCDGGDDDGGGGESVNGHDKYNYETLGRVCNGQGVGEAGLYNPHQPGPHPVMLSFTLGYSNPPHGLWPTTDWWNRIPPDWYHDYKESISNIELVACVGSDFDIIVGGPCKYNKGPDIFLARHARHIVLRDAYTAGVIAEETFEGSAPGGCPETAAMNATRHYGAHYYSYEAVQNWLGQYVYP
jgi:hypothetical protein